MMGHVRLEDAISYLEANDASHGWEERAVVEAIAYLIPTEQGFYHEDLSHYIALSGEWVGGPLYLGDLFAKLGLDPERTESIVRKLTDEGVLLSRPGKYPWGYSHMAVTVCYLERKARSRYTERFANLAAWTSKSSKVTLSEGTSGDRSVATAPAPSRVESQGASRSSAASPTDGTGSLFVKSFTTEGVPPPLSQSPVGGRSERLQTMKLVLEIGVVVVTLVGGIVALLWRSQ